VIRSRLKKPSTADIKPFVNLGEEYKVQYLLQIIVRQYFDFLDFLLCAGVNCLHAEVSELLLGLFLGYKEKCVYQQ
jgi:hypothetical protein